MLLGFLYELREKKVPVGIQEWLVLLNALSEGLHESSLTGFYHLARSLLIHTEAHFDAFDQAFAHYFKDVESDSLELTDELAQWLKDPALLRYLSEEQRAALEALDLDELRRLFEERLKEQKERHQGGSRWIGTGGTSPFGQGGSHPTGIRIGGARLGGSAAQVAAIRRYRAYRNDLVLDVRQIQMALCKLRELRRDGQANELNLDKTVDRTCRNAGELELVWQPPRKNNVRVLLLMDVGGSMIPHAKLVSLLFSAAHASRHLREFRAFYFHNCVYDRVYLDAWFKGCMTIAELKRTYGPHYKLVMVGDALMHPMELLNPGGAIDYWHHNITPGIEWLRTLTDHFQRKAWLNPEPPRFWNHITINSIRQLFPMYPLTLDGLQEAVAALVKARGRGN
ncbi:MAG: VWA domain-containing protein [Pseudomonadota bacterium]